MKWSIKWSSPYEIIMMITIILIKIIFLVSFARGSQLVSINHNIRPGVDSEISTLKPGDEETD